MTTALATASPAHPERALLASLDATLARTLDPLVPRDAGVVLVDFPHTANVGDSMIWLGTLRWLARSGRGAPRHVVSEVTYDRHETARRLGDGTLLISGGGNFGDLYPNHQALRERVIADFPAARIVQLPQAIHFDTPAAIERAARVIDRHRDLTLLVRDEGSLEFARAHFGVPSALCPDMAFALGELRRPHPPTRPVVWLSRGDKEEVAEPGFTAPPGLERVDWLTDDPRPTFRVYRRLVLAARGRPALRAWWAPWLTPAFERIARKRVERGMRILGDGRVVVTNRLHGYVLALLLGIPHFITDNSYGKVRGLHERWTPDSKLTHFCATQAEALARALAAAGD